MILKTKILLEKKSLEDLVAMSAHDPDNLNPCEKKEKV